MVYYFSQLLMTYWIFCTAISVSSFEMLPLRTRRTTLLEIAIPRTTTLEGSDFDSSSVTWFKNKHFHRKLFLHVPLDDNGHSPPFYKDIFSLKIIHAYPWNPVHIVNGVRCSFVLMLRTMPNRLLIPFWGFLLRVLVSPPAISTESCNQPALGEFHILNFFVFFGPL